MKNIQMEKAFTAYSDYSGLYDYSKDIVVISQYPKNYPVFIHYKNGENWYNVAMTLNRATDKLCIWEYQERIGNDCNNEGVFPEETDIAIYQDTNIGRVWDNNYGKNYHLGLCDGPFLGQNIAIKLYESHCSLDIFSGVIFLKNLGYEKDVTIVYTTDKNQTTTTCKASFDKFYKVGVHQMIFSPNVNNCEIFTFSTQVGDAKEIDFYLKYEVNGEVYIDDNYGANYSISLNS